MYEEFMGQHTLNGHIGNRTKLLAKLNWPGIKIKRLLEIAVSSDHCNSTITFEWEVEWDNDPSLKCLSAVFLLGFKDDEPILALYESIEASRSQDDMFGDELATVRMAVK